jgi:surface polysaccharide O-acyltransferase-like enzyme
MAVDFSRPAPVRAVAVSRLLEVDLLKAVGILVVVLIHAARPQWSSHASAFEQWLGTVTRFAVPAFLFASGLLIARDPDPVGRLGARLRRLLVPYVLATLVAEVYNAWVGYPWTPGSVLFDLAFGGAFGPYYYVFAVFQLSLLTPLLARAPRAVFWGIFAISLYWQAAAELGWVIWMPLYWYMRVALMWLPYFQLGWWLGEHRDAVLDLLDRHAAVILVGLSVLAVVPFVAAARIEFNTYLGRAFAWAHVYVMVALLFAAGLRLVRLPAPLVHLSDSTYFVYLYHLPIVYSVVTLATHLHGDDFSAAWIAVVWAAGFAIPLAVLALAQRAFGARTRAILGA